MSEIILDQMNKNELYTLKNPEEIQKMREAGKIAANILTDLNEYVKPGVTTRELDKIVYDLIVNKYHAEIDRSDLEGNNRNTIQTISYSRNHILGFGEVDDAPLKIGEIFGIDVSLKKGGFCADTAKMWIIGNETSSLARRLLAVAYEAMWIGIKLVKPGVHIGTISSAVQNYVEKQGFSMVRIPGMTAHSIGRVHCEGLLIPFYDATPYTGHILEEGMTITIEPAICTGDGTGKRLNNSMTTMVMQNNALACFWEHVVAVTNSGYEVLDLREGESVLY